MHGCGGESTDLNIRGPERKSVRLYSTGSVGTKFEELDLHGVTKGCTLRRMRRRKRKILAVFFGRPPQLLRNPVSTLQNISGPFLPDLEDICASQRAWTILDIQTPRRSKEVVPGDYGLWSFLRQNKQWRDQATRFFQNISAPDPCLRSAQRALKSSNTPIHARNRAGGKTRLLSYADSSSKTF